MLQDNKPHLRATGTPPLGAAAPPLLLPTHGANGEALRGVEEEEEEATVARRLLTREEEEETGTGYQPLRRHPRPYGKNHLLWGREGQRFPFFCLIGPDWLCLIFTFLLIWIPPLAILSFIASYASSGLIAAMLVSLFLVTWTLCGAAFNDPGILLKMERNPSPPPPLARMRTSQVNPVNLEEGTAQPPAEEFRLEPTRDGMTLCPRCLVYRPKGAFHCHDCNCCIEELDHHCPWTSRCIGAKNMLYFKLYLFFLSVHVVVTILGAVLGSQARVMEEHQRQGR